MRRTELISGIATGVRYTVHVSGDKSGVSTSHHTIFNVGDMTVMFTSAAPALISDGDRLVLAGRRKGARMLLADAYLNQTAGIRGDAGLWLSFAAMLFCLLLGGTGFGLLLLGPFIPSLPTLEGWPLLFALLVVGVFCGVGLYNLVRWLRIRGAVALVRAGR
jgi:hypothetical protein